MTGFINCKYRELASGVHVYSFDTKVKAQAFAKYFGGDYDYWSCVAKDVNPHVVYLKKPVHNVHGVIQGPPLQ